jgi:hypothetical protein
VCVGKDFIPPSRPQVCIATKEGQKAVTDAIMFLSGKARQREPIAADNGELTALADDLAKRWAAGGAAPGTSYIYMRLLLLLLLLMMCDGRHERRGSDTIGGSGRRAASGGERRRRQR